MQKITIVLGLILIITAVAAGIPRIESDDCTDIGGNCQLHGTKCDGTMKEFNRTTCKYGQFCCVPSNDTSRINEGGSCEGIAELREEVSMLKTVIHELKDMMKTQSELLMHTHSHHHAAPDHKHDDLTPVGPVHPHGDMPMEQDMVTEEENTTESTWTPENCTPCIPGVTCCTCQDSCFILNGSVLGEDN